MSDSPESSQLLRELADYWEDDVARLPAIVFTHPELTDDFVRPRILRLRQLLSRDDYQRLSELLWETRTGQSRKEYERQIEEERRSRDLHRQHVEKCRAEFRRGLEAQYLASNPRRFAREQQVAVDELFEEQSSFIDDWIRDRRIARLDADQAAAVGAIGEHILVTARAGSGKTRTLSTRALFLTEHCGVAPDEILLLAFNRDAAREMRERIEQLGAFLPHVMTFHALAYAIVHPEETLLYDLPDDSGLALSEAFQHVLNGLIDQQRFHADVQKLMLGHFRSDWDRLVDAGLTLSRRDGLAFRRSLERETLRGEYVKSHGEKAIANFLFEHDIPYQYEKSYWWEHRNYRPDFTVADGHSEVVIEYFGLTGDPDYDKESDEKRKFWQRQPERRFVEMMPKDIVRIDEVLAEKLRKCGLSFRRLSDDEIWSRIRDRAVTKFARLVKHFVGRCRSASLSRSRLNQLIADHQVISDIESTFLRLAEELCAAYLRRNEVIGNEDFAGLLERAAIALENGKTVFDRKSGKGDIRKIRFVMVDEFQDFSPLFLRMLQAIQKNNPEVCVFGVGDDWQAINGFAGSELKYFSSFDHFFSPARLLTIGTNYRSSSEVVDVGNTIMVGRGNAARPSANCAAGRILVADLNRFVGHPRETELHSTNPFMAAVKRIVFKAVEGNGSVRLVSRTNTLPYFCGTGVGSNQLESCRRLWVKGLTEEQKTRVSVSTAHKCKGLEAKTVVILDALEGRYPLIHQDWVFMRIFGDSVERIVDDERRLFYVACTRAIDTLIFVTENGRESEFLKEVEPKCALLDWNAFPFPTNSEQRLIVRIGSSLGGDRAGTFIVREELKADGYQFGDGGDGKHWAKTFAGGVENLASCVESLTQRPWFRRGNGLEVRVCDLSEEELDRFQIWEGKMTRQQSTAKDDLRGK